MAILIAVAVSTEFAMPNLGVVEMAAFKADQYVPPALMQSKSNNNEQLQ